MKRVPSESSEIQPGAIRVRGINRAEGDESSSKFDDDPVFLVRGGNEPGAVRTSTAGDRNADPFSSTAQPLHAIESGTFSLSSNSTTAESDRHPLTVTATAFTRDEHEQELRDRILQEAVVAQVSIEEGHAAPSDLPSKAKTTYPSRVFVTLAVVAVAAIVAGTLCAVLKGHGNSTPSPASSNNTTSSASRLWTPEQLKEFIIAELGSSQGFELNGSSPSKASYELILNGGVFDSTTLGTQIMDAFVIMSLWSGTGGSNVWKRSDLWNKNPNPCSWFGIGCDGTGRVSKISVPGNNLDGPLSSNLWYIADHLTYLDVSDNHVGIFLFNLTVLPNLKYLNFSKNTNSGYRLGEITNYNLARLEVLDLSSNVLIGPISSEIAQLGSLRELHLQDNALTGAIPDEISLLRNLSTLQLGSNRLTGTVPTEICSRAAETGKRVGISVDCESVNCSCCSCASS
jgi:Leucine-rich repeat (LRR) protein